MRARGGPVKVVFLVLENAKWNGDSLYKKLAESPRFQPQVLVVVPKNADLSKNADYQFFKDRKYDFAAISNLDDLRRQNPDMVFYQQPWLLRAGGFYPAQVSKFALCFYFPYSISTTIELPRIWSECKIFFRTLFRQFVFSSEVSDQFASRGIRNTVAVGHPKLDAFGQPIGTNPWRDKDKFKIIYAPHHSFDDGSLGWATFQWNGREILEYAKAHKETEWIFKPHPFFPRKAVENQIMTRDELCRYFDEWREIGQVCETGDYFDMFRTADLLVTDCGSFLTEWLPTGNPCIHLLSDDGRPKPRNFVQERSAAHYYKVKNLAELFDALEMLVRRREDPLGPGRKKAAAGIMTNSADNIFGELSEILK